MRKKPKNKKVNQIIFINFTCKLSGKFLLFSWVAMCAYVFYRNICVLQKLFDKPLHNMQYNCTLWNTQTPFYPGRNSGSPSELSPHRGLFFIKKYFYSFLSTTNRNQKYMSAIIMSSSSTCFFSKDTSIQCRFFFILSTYHIAMFSVTEITSPLNESSVHQHASSLQAFCHLNKFEMSQANGWEWLISGVGYKSPAMKDCTEFEGLPWKIWWNEAVEKKVCHNKWEVK